MNALFRNNLNNQNDSRLARLFSWLRGFAARLLASSGSRGLYL